MKLVIVRPLADWDLDEKADYLRHSSPRVAMRSYVAARSTFDRLANMPGLGSPCEFINPAFADLYFYPIRRFPKYLIFFRRFPNGIEVVRVLHSAQDVERIFAEAD